MPLFRKRLAVFFFIFLSLFTIKNDLLAKPAELKSEESLPVPSSSPSPYLKWAILGVAPAVLFGYGATAWWDQGFSNKMTFDQDEGFFGASSYSGGSDKLGHMFAAYVTSKILNGLLFHAALNRAFSSFQHFQKPRILIFCSHCLYQNHH